MKRPDNLVSVDRIGYQEQLAHELRNSNYDIRVNIDGRQVTIDVNPYGLFDGDYAQNPTDSLAIIKKKVVEANLYANRGHTFVTSLYLPKDMDFNELSRIVYNVESAIIKVDKRYIIRVEVDTERYHKHIVDTLTPLVKSKLGEDAIFSIDLNFDTESKTLTTLVNLFDSEEHKGGSVFASTPLSYSDPSPVNTAEFLFVLDRETHYHADILQKLPDLMYATMCEVNDLIDGEYR